MRLVGINDYEVTIALQRDDCRLLAKACESFAGSADEQDMLTFDAMQTAFELAVKASIGAEAQGMLRKHPGAVAESDIIRMPSAKDEGATA